MCSACTAQNCSEIGVFSASTFIETTISIPSNVSRLLKLPLLLARILRSVVITRRQLLLMLQRPRRCSATTVRNSFRINGLYSTTYITNTPTRARHRGIIVALQEPLESRVTVKIQQRHAVQVTITQRGHFQVKITQKGHFPVQTTQICNFPVKTMQTSQFPVRLRQKGHFPVKITEMGHFLVTKKRICNFPFKTMQRSQFSVKIT